MAPAADKNGVEVRKPISIAMCISTALHAGLLVLIVWGLERDQSLPSMRQELLVSIDGQHAAGQEPLPSPEDASRASRDEAPESPPAAASTAPPETAKAPEPEPEPVVDAAPETGTAPAETQAAAAPLPTPLAEEAGAIADTAAEASALLTTESTTTTVTRKVVQPLDPRQQKMFDKKIREWTETYHKRRDGDDEVSWQDKGQRYTARFAQVPADDDMALDRLTIDISTEVDGERLTTRMQMKRLAFSSYAQFINRWDEDVQIHDDELDGRFHANSAINLTYDRDAKPQFHGKVTTSARRINITAVRARARRDEMFLGGLQTGVRSIRLPKNFIPLPQNARVRDDQVQEFDEDTRITFHPDGSYTWVSFENGLFERRGHLREPASYLLAAKKAKLHVRGKVNGKVLIYSPEQIVIVDDLVYAGDPDARTDGDDFIGLVSDKTIRIAEPKVTGPGDLEVHGAIYAKRRFMVARYRDREGGGTLKIFGSLTAGSLSATEPRFATRIRFDPRLEAARPPGFPVTDRYEVESWDSSWTVDAAHSL